MISVRRVFLRLLGTERTCLNHFFSLRYRLVSLRSLCLRLFVSCGHFLRLLANVATQVYHISHSSKYPLQTTTTTPLFSSQFLFNIYLQSSHLIDPFTIVYSQPYRTQKIVYSHHYSQISSLKSYLTKLSINFVCNLL